MPWRANSTPPRFTSLHPSPSSENVHFSELSCFYLNTQVFFRFEKASSSFVIFAHRAFKIGNVSPLHPPSEWFSQMSSASPQLFLTRPESQTLNTQTHARTHTCILGPRAPQTGANVCGEACGVLWWGVCSGRDWTGVRGMRDLAGLRRCLALIGHSPGSFLLRLPQSCRPLILLCVRLCVRVCDACAEQAVVFRMFQFLHVFRKDGKRGKQMGCCGYEPEKCRWCLTDGSGDHLK